jgi:acyl carrier protein
VTRDETRAVVLDVLRTVAPEAVDTPLADDRSLRAQLDLDSLDFLAFVERLVERTGARIEESDYPQIDTLEGCVAFLTGSTRSPS